MTPIEDADRVPDIVLERYHLGEMSAAEKADLERRLREDDSLRDRLSALGRSDAEIRLRYPDGWLADRVRERQRAGTAQARPRPFSWRVPAAVAAALVVLGVLVPRLGRAPQHPPAVADDADNDRVKGLQPALAMYRKTAEGSETLADGALAHEGDVVRVGYRSAGRAYGVIVSIDGRGAVTLHLPAEGVASAAQLQAGETVLLDRAYELDAAPQWECFFFVTSMAPFDVATVVASARSAAAAAHGTRPPALGLPPALATATFTLRKEETP